jgi:hypothetical protein
MSPADYQITKHYQCQNCDAEIQMESCYVPNICHCGGKYTECGESYPADAGEWAEQSDPDGE